MIKVEKFIDGVTKTTESGIIKYMLSNGYYVEIRGNTIDIVPDNGANPLKIDYDQLFDKEGTDNAASYVEYLIVNSFFFDIDTSSANSLSTTYNAINFSDIINVAPSPTIGETVFTNQSQGIRFINYKAGQTIYVWNGSEWISDPEELEELIGVNRDDIAAMVIVNSNQDTAIASNATSISSEATVRTNADVTLQSNISTEESQRISSDVTLQGNIDSEESSRVSSDNTLQANIGAEALTRQSVDESTVTVHNDVSDAGSGEIITSQERTDINGSVGVHSDVTLTGVNPEDGWQLELVSGQWIPVMRKVIRSSILQINNATAFVNKINQAINFQRVGIYSVSVSYSCSMNTINTQFLSRISIGGLDLPNVGNQAMVEAEMKDSTGNEGDGRGTDAKYPHSLTYHYNNTTLGNKVVTLSFAATTINDAAAMWDATIIIKEEFNITGS